MILQKKNISILAYICLSGAFVEFYLSDETGLQPWDQLRQCLKWHFFLHLQLFIILSVII